MDCKAEIIIQIWQWKLTDMRQRHYLGSSPRRNLLVSLDNVLSSTELSYCAYRMDYELGVDIDGIKKTNFCLLTLRKNQTKSKSNPRGQWR